MPLLTINQKNLLPRYSSRRIGLKTSLKVHSVFSLMDILNMLLTDKITSQMYFKWRIHPAEFWLESQLWLTIVNFAGKQRADGNRIIFSCCWRIFERISIIFLKAIEVWTPILACFEISLDLLAHLYYRMFGYLLH